MKKVNLRIVHVYDAQEKIERSPIRIQLGGSKGWDLNSGLKPKKSIRIVPFVPWPSQRSLPEVYRCCFGKHRYRWRPLRNDP